MPRDIYTIFRAPGMLTGKTHQVVPASLGVKNGDNATIQVVSNGDPNGGLYNVLLPLLSSSTHLSTSLTPPSQSAQT